MADTLDDDVDFEDDSSVVLMDEDDTAADSSLPPKPEAMKVESKETDMEKQLKVLDGYISSLPYECESQEEMQQRLDFIVGRLIVSAESRNWEHTVAWDGALASWMTMKYPLARPMRAKLARLYYELILVPALEPRYIHAFATGFDRLLVAKQGMKRRLELDELTLPWQPLWDAMMREIWPSKRAYQATRNLHNIFMHVAEVSSEYYPPSEIPNILETFLPNITQDTASTMFDVLSAFVPSTHPHLYLPFVFKAWEAFHSYKIEDSILTIIGTLSVQHVAGKAGDFGEEGCLQWKDIGIYTEAEWMRIMRSCLSSMNIPVGNSKGGNSTSQHADRTRPSMLKSATPRFSYFAQIIVYSMSVDGKIRPLPEEQTTAATTAAGVEMERDFLAGSRALDSLDRLINSVQSYFHPSNYGIWAIALTSFMQRLTSEFSKRWNEEQAAGCKTPQNQRLTPQIKRALVLSLRTPALLSIFSKDPLSTSYAQGALKHMAMLEPELVMPMLLERAFSGLESINETHRTTAAISLLAAVSTPIITRDIWLQGQRNLLPLLELCLPGIDINDATKTVCTTMFIISALQNVKIGDLNVGGAMLLSDDMLAEETSADYSSEGYQTPRDRKVITEEEREEDIIVKQSTSGFADWVVSFFRRVFALYENLPEEGGRSGKTGGKSEEAVLKAIGTALDVVCANLSDGLFDLVLNLTFDYCASNARSNSIRSIGNLVNSMARTRPKEMLAKFLPFAKRQIEIEIAAGASNTRTTSSMASAIPSDTTLYWNMTIVRAVLAYGGSSLLDYKDDILSLINTLRQCKSERGYSGNGRMISRIMGTLIGTYNIETRLVNPTQWKDPVFARKHHHSWGKLYGGPKEVDICWHQPSRDEIQFVLEILDNIVSPTLTELEALVEIPINKRDSVWRNDFCRHLYLVRSVWSGLSTLFVEQEKTDGVDPYDEDTVVHGLTPSFDRPKAGFALPDPSDPRHQAAVAHRERFGRFLHAASRTVLENDEPVGKASADSVDASIQLLRAIDTYLLDYALHRDHVMATKKTFMLTRDLLKTHPKQRHFPRIIWIKRAQLYHYNRIYQHSAYRSRSALDDQLFLDLMEMTMSPYTRVRKHAQTILITATAYYRRATRFVIPKLIDALATETAKGKDADPDRQKGALHTLSDKGIMSFCLNLDPERYVTTLLQCQSQEKPSIQNLVGNLVRDSVAALTEEFSATSTLTLPLPLLADAISEIKAYKSASADEEEVLKDAKSKVSVRVNKAQNSYKSLMSALLLLARSPETHWRYVQYSTRYTLALLCRDQVAAPELAQHYMTNVNSDHPSLRSYSERGITTLLLHIKMRTFSESTEQLWLNQWRNPLRRTITVNNPEDLLADLERSDGDNVLVDQEHTGFLVWAKTVDGYASPPENSPVFVWESASEPALQIIRDSIDASWVDKFITHLGQEGSKASSTSSVDLRSDHVAFVKSLSKMFESSIFEAFQRQIEASLSDDDKYKKRAGLEALAGLSRGSKHWPKSSQTQFWGWLSSILPRAFDDIKPDTIHMWETFVNMQLSDRDPRRNQPLVDLISNLTLDFAAESAFAVTKRLTLLGGLLDSLGARIGDTRADELTKLLFDNVQTPYAEVRSQVSVNLAILISIQWHPRYNTVASLLAACINEQDPLVVRKAQYLPQVISYVEQLPKWREERLPPPRVSHSTYDRVGLALLQWIWSTAYSVRAPSMFPYIMPLLPEIFKMAELNDSSDIQLYSGAVLYILSAVTPPQEFVEPVMDQFIDAVRNSPSWRIRLSVLPVLQVFYFRNLLNLPNSCAKRIMDVLLNCLRDENVEVRESASKTLSGVIRCSQQHSILPLRERFSKLARRTKLPRRNDKEAFGEALRTLHSAVLGLVALVDAYPYSVEPWVPETFEVLARYSSDPPPISTSIRKCAASFKQTHQDTWAMDQLLFNEDQMQALATVVSGTSYYA